ncbi:MAG TPA: efflux RND transporter periplasmic adaptor subunit [Geothrix sp.]|nr:efflux RND transporter periplasmic adaptor subunit [Geothrix sp.]
MIAATSRRPIAWALVLGLTLTGTLACNHKEGADDHAHGAAAHGHEAPERPSLAPTLYADGLELFVEYAVLVAGETSTFGAHLTHLEGFQAVKDGRAEVILTGAGGEQRFGGEVSATPGIFRMAPKPKAAGEVQVRILWKGPKGQATFDLGKHTVYPDLAAARKAQVPEAEGGIPFLKEQQWNVPFGTTEAKPRPLYQGFEAYGTVQAVPGGEGRVLAPVAGRLDGAEMVRGGPPAREARDVPPGAPHTAIEQSPMALSTYPNVGQSVRKGQRLAALVPKAGLDLSQGTVQLDFERARLRQEQTAVNLTRMKGLLEQDAVPKRRVEEATREAALADTEFKVAQARRDEATLGRGGMAIALTAPVSGVVSAVNGGPGIQVAEGQELFHIVDTRRLRLEVQVPEAQAGRLAKVASVWFQAPGVPAMLLDPNQGARMLGQGGAIHPERRTVPFLVAFANPTGALKVGHTGKVFVRVGSPSQGLAIPASALQDEDGLSVVYVQAGGERFLRRIVQTGARDGDWVQILGGVQPGERVVTLGAHLVRLAASSGKVPEHGHAH